MKLLTPEQLAEIREQTKCNCISVECTECDHEEVIAFDNWQRYRCVSCGSGEIILDDYAAIEVIHTLMEHRNQCLDHSTALEDKLETAIIELNGECLEHACTETKLEAAESFINRVAALVASQNGTQTLWAKDAQIKCVQGEFRRLHEIISEETFFNWAYQRYQLLKQESES